MYRIASNLLVLLAVAIMTAPFVVAVQPNCDPFESVQRTNQSTCQGSKIEYYADGSMLTLTASLARCASANPDSTVSVFFDLLTAPIIDKTLNTWTLSYSIMWSDPATNCVVDFTSTASGVTPKVSFALPYDTNGLNNSPLTNISDYALNQWYTRSFVINGSALSSFKFGFTCASQTPGSNMQQVAYVRDITWRSGSNEGTVYNSLRSCVDCNHETPIEGADCLSFGDEYRWVYEGNINGGTLMVDAPLTVLGNVTASQLSVRSVLDIRGCLVNSPDNYYKNYDYVAPLLIWGYREQQIVIRQDPKCVWPYFIVIPTTSEAFPNMYNDEITCPNFREPGTRSNGSDITTVTGDAIVIYAPNSIFECYQDDYTWITAIIVPIVGTAGIIVGIVFGVRKCRQVKRAKQLDLEMEEQIDRVDPMGHCPPAQ